MIVHTKYRDISFEEACKCYCGEPTEIAYKPWWENNMRGKSVSIIAPATTDSESRTTYLVCEGPFYRISGKPENHIACPHIAEIGD